MQSVWLQVPLTLTRDIELLKPDYKVSITHSGTSIDYIGEFSKLQVTRRENNYDTAHLFCNNNNSKFYTSLVNVLDEVKVYFKDGLKTATYTQVFGGHARQANPMFTKDSGYLLELKCKGYGAALEETHCNIDYGLESSQSSLHHIKLIISDLVDNYINKSLGSGGGSTGHSIARSSGGGGVASTIADLYSATEIKYINNPYRANIEVLDQVLDLSSAIGAGSTAGGHWIVDNAKNLLVNTIGAHENTTEWPDWWNTNQVGSTLTQGIDFVDFKILDKSEEFANKIIVITDFRRPSYDYWTETNITTHWNAAEQINVTSDAATFNVGANSLKLECAAALTAGYANMSAGATVWNIDKWGSSKTIPRCNFFFNKSGNVAENNTFLMFYTTGYKTDFFYTPFCTSSAPDNQWVYASVPIGDNWKSEADKSIDWKSSGAPDWSSIAGVTFQLGGAAIAPVIYIDDFHFTGKIIREAKNSTNITANNEYQKVFIARNSMDDSCIASDDTGMVGRIAYSELLRRQSLPYSITFTTYLQPSMMAGQKCHIHALKKMDGTYTIDTDMRMTEIQHIMENSGAFSIVTATTDLLNSRAISTPDQYSTIMENTLINSKEAKDMRAGAEVDLTIPVLSKDYP